jgi:hypothetical protein
MLTPAVFPIYISNTKHYELFGSCVLVKYAGQFLLISASHVFRELARRNFYVVFGADTVKFKSSYVLVSGEKAEISFDSRIKFDVGIMLLPDKIVNHLAQQKTYQHVTEQHIIANKGNPNGDYWMVGYPGSKNTRSAYDLKIGEHINTSELVVYEVKGHSEYKPFNVSIYDQQHNIAVKIEKNIFRVVETAPSEITVSRVDCPKLKGMSGGLLMKGLDQNGTLSMYPAGILIYDDPKKNAFVALKLEFVFKWLQNWLSEYLPSLKNEKMIEF